MTVANETFQILTAGEVPARSRRCAVATLPLSDNQHACNNAFNNIVWDNPELNVSSPNFGKVTRKRIDGTGREVQFGLRFVF